MCVDLETGEDISEHTCRPGSEGTPECANKLASEGVIHRNGVVAGRGKQVPALAKRAVAARLHGKLREQPAHRAYVKIHAVLQKP